MESTNNNSNGGCVLGFSVLIVLIIFAIIGSATSTPDPNADACSYAQVFVRRQLKAPSTADFPPCSDMRITQDGSAWTVASYVDAENSFGAMLRNNFVAVLKFDQHRDEWRALDVQIFAP